MKAMLLASAPGRLTASEIPAPAPGDGEVLIEVSVCGVCRTDLHIVDGELPSPALPLIPGHQIVGRVVAVGGGVEAFTPGDRVGVPWLSWTCGECSPCRHGRENLCENARFTGYTVNGGFAEYAVANAAYCFALPNGYDDVHAAPLLCAGMIGYRALRFTGDAHAIGLYGFGAAAHIVCQIATHQGREIHAFTRTGDVPSQALAVEVGAVWAGGSDDHAPAALDAAIVFAPAGELVVTALRSIGPGGTVVCAGIHMSDIPAFPYSLLWQERSIRSVANLTRDDGRDFIAAAAAIPLSLHVEVFRMADANLALDRLRGGAITGAAVLQT